MCSASWRLSPTLSDLGRSMTGIAPTSDVVVTYERHGACSHCTDVIPGVAHSAVN